MQIDTLAALTYFSSLVFFLASLNRLCVLAQLRVTQHMRQGHARRAVTQSRSEDALLALYISVRLARC
jgi:hypothetical protein